MEPHSRWDFKDALMEDRWRTVAARYVFFPVGFYDVLVISQGFKA